MIVKPLRLILILLCLSVSLISCNRSGGSNNRKLLIYTPHGQDLLRDFVTRYKSQNPETDVQFLDMGSQDVLTRVRAERNRPQADLWWGASQTTFQTAAEENLLAPYKPSWADKVTATERDPNDLWYATYETPEVIVYNSEAVSAQEAPHDWDDVLDQKWRDKVLIRDPVPSDTMRVIFGAMIYRFYKDNGSPEKGYDWLRKLDANVHEYTADGTLLMQKIARREGLVTLWDLPDVRIFQEKKLPIAYLVPSSGTPVITEAIAIIRGAPNEAEARRFYEFVTTPESLIHAAKTYDRIPIRSDLDRSQLPGWMNQPFPSMELDWNVLRKQSADWMRYWDTQIRGHGK